MRGEQQWRMVRKNIVGTAVFLAVSYPLASLIWGADAFTWKVGAFVVGFFGLVNVVHYALAWMAVRLVNRIPLGTLSDEERRIAERARQTIGASEDANDE